MLKMKNREGLTFEQWRAVATMGTADPRWKEPSEAVLVSAWGAGEPPDDWRIVRQNGAVRLPNGKWVVLVVSDQTGPDQ